MSILVVYGRRERERSLGHAADFCPVCRKVRAFEIFEITIAAHIYFIPIERGNFLEHRQKCRSCHNVSSCYLGQYLTLSKAAKAPLEILVQETFPSIYEVYKGRLEFEARVSSATSPQDLQLRKKALLEAFHLALPHFEGGFGQEGRRILAQSLKPLNPSEDEVRECLQFFRQHRTRMGAKLRTVEVLDSIRPQEQKLAPGQFDY